MVSQFELADLAAFAGAGKCTFPIAEKLGLDEIPGIAAQEMATNGPSCLGLWCGWPGRTALCRCRFPRK